MKQWDQVGKGFLIGFRQIGYVPFSDFLFFAEYHSRFEKSFQASQRAQQCTGIKPNKYSPNTPNQL
jgi:hypothetical protein